MNQTHLMVNQEHPGAVGNSSASSMTGTLGDRTLDIIYRRATPSDAPAVAHLIGHVWSKFFGYSVSPSDLKTYLSTTLSPSQVERDISNPQMRFLLAVLPEDNNSIVGVAQLVTRSTEPCLTLPSPIELQRLYVSESLHGRGVANALIKRSEEIGKEEDCKSMWLGVWEDNQKAQRFYSKMGFKTVGEHKFIVGDSVRRDWIMEKRI